MGTDQAEPLTAGTVRQWRRERTGALAQVARDVTVGGLSLAVDFAVLVVLHDLTRAPLWLPRRAATPARSRSTSA